MNKLNQIKTRDCTLVQVYLPPDWAIKVRAAAALQGMGAGRWIAQQIEPKVRGMHIESTQIEIEEAAIGATL